MEILEAIVLLSAICNFFLGLFVFLKDPSKKINRLFGICGVITAIWVFANFMMGAKGTIFWLKSASAFGALVPISAILWILEFCEKKITSREIFLLYGTGFLFFIISYINNLIVSNVEKVYLGGFEGETGPFFISYWIYIFVSLAFIVYTLISGYFSITGIRKTQISYVMVGAILYISIVCVVSFILPLFGILKFTALDSPSSLFLIFFTTLAITRHHLFGIRLILTEILVGAIGLVLLVQAMTAETLGWQIFGFILLILFGFLGYLLIKTTLEEIRRREEIEKLSDQLMISNVRLESALKEVEKLDKAKTEFLSIASHQLRTPLSAIKGYLAMVKEGLFGKPSEKIIDVLNKVYLSNERLISLVNSLLDISRIEMGRMEMHFEKIQIEKIVESVLEELSFQAKTKGLSLSFKRPKKPLLKLKLDEDKIRQVILNLVDNAIKYTEKGRVAVKAEVKDLKMLVSVADTGIGMTKEELSKIFQLYVRGKGMKLFPEGAGLGLYVAKKLVQAHLGKIWAESPGKGKGSTFFVELPIK